MCYRALLRAGSRSRGEGYLVVSDLGGTTAYRALQQGIPYCSPAVPNSTGVSARISARGSHFRPDDDLVLRASDLPLDTSVLFLNSMTQASVPGAGGSLGVLCLGGGVGRFVRAIRSTEGRGSVEVRVDMNAQPQPTSTVSVMAGQTWSYQAWYRDTNSGVPVSNFTDAVALSFL